MKNFIITLCAICISIFAHAQTETLNWYIDGQTYATTTCESGGDILLPTAPTKRGYTFKGWASYIPIEYLESTGTQYIDTGVKQSNYFKNLIVKAEFQYSDIQGIQMICGITSNGSYFYPLYISNGYFMSQSGTAGTEIQLKNADMEKHKFIFNAKQKNITFDNSNYYFDNNEANVQNNIPLFAKFGVPDRFALIKIYSISFLTGDNTLIRDFIPVLDPDGVPCMYDKVENKFYYNQGTGDFIAGPVIGE